MPAGVLTRPYGYSYFRGLHRCRHPLEKMEWRRAPPVPTPGGALVRFRPVLLTPTPNFWVQEPPQHQAERIEGDQKKKSLKATRHSMTGGPLLSILCASLPPSSRNSITFRGLAHSSESPLRVLFFLFAAVTSYREGRRISDFRFGLIQESGSHSSYYF